MSDRNSLRQQLEKDKVEFLLAQFVDVHGAAKVKMVPSLCLTDVIETGRGCFACALGGPEGRTLFLLTGEGFTGAGIRARTASIEAIDVTVPAYS